MIARTSAESDDWWPVVTKMEGRLAFIAKPRTTTRDAQKFMRNILI